MTSTQRLRLFPQLTPIYHWNKNSTKRIRVNQGGTNSGKTYGILQVIIALLIENPNWTATVVADTWPTLERGALRDFLNIIKTAPLLEYYLVNHKLKKGPFEFVNGSKIEFVTVKDPLDARHGKRQILFGNEANALSYDSFQEMEIRTEHIVFIDYNPNSKFWVHDEYVGNDDTDLFISTYKHNPFCPAPVIRKIRSYYRKWKLLEAEGNPGYKRWRNKYRVYGQGLTGIVEGVIFEEVYYQTLFPMDANKQCYVIDWGFRNDPLAMIRAGVIHNRLYGKELVYERNMTTPHLLQRFAKIGVKRNDLIIADNSNWDGIGQLLDRGYNVKPAHKPPNSRKTGIKLLLDYEIYITNDSINWKDEQEKYKYKKDRNGIFTDEPQDGDDHLWDCLRYYGQTELVGKKPNDRKKKRRRANV